MSEFKTLNQLLEYMNDHPGIFGWKSRCEALTEFAEGLENKLAAIMAVLPDDAKPCDAPDLISHFKSQMGAHASRGIELEKQLKDARAEIERLRKWYIATIQSANNDVAEQHELIQQQANRLAERDKLIEQMRVVSEHRKAIMLEIADSLESNKLMDSEE